MSGIALHRKNNSRKRPRWCGWRHLLDQQVDALAADLDPSLHPYRGRLPSCTQLPQQNRVPDDILAEMGALQESERRRWQAGYVSGAVYHGDLAPVYGMAASMPMHGVVGELLKRVVDAIYRTES